MKAFQDKLHSCSTRNDSLLCVGLDPEPESLPEQFSQDAAGILSFNRMVIEATSDLVCAYKPNLAFYEAMGSEGWRLLEHTLALIPSHIPTIADAKRGDVPNTARMYARALFGSLGVDSVTVSPYMGLDTLEPFLDWEGKGVWVLCRTSNSGARDLQDLPLSNDEPLYLRVLRLVLDAPAKAAKGVVVGATYPQQLEAIRSLAPEMPLLVPGAGAQGGDLASAARAASFGPVVINSSRGILYGPSGQDVADGVRTRATRLRDQINNYRPEHIGAAY
ncbi:MAG: orotidine-5'-phosphate decarboxylase [Chloroflexota bacterium]|nr:orotidine-5'-phosphate decarboxylase [Chloroflexota bacterium]